MASSAAPGEAGGSYQIEQWSEKMDSGEITGKYLYVLVGDERSAVRSGKHLIKPGVISLGWDERVLHALERARDELIRNDEAAFDRIHGRYERVSRQVKDTCKVKKTFASMVEGSRAAEILQYLKENTEIDDNHFSWACHKSYSAFSALNGSSAEESEHKCVELFEHIKSDLLDHLNTKVAAPYKARYDAQCRRMFISFILEIEAIVPGIRALRNMCIDLNAAYGGASLRERMSNLEATISECTIEGIDDELNKVNDWDDHPPRSWCVVRNIDLFYRAKLLDDCYAAIEKTKRIRAYSHRMRGWTTGSFVLLNQEDCRLEVGTNFGYGRSSYFHDVLSYKGIKLLQYEAVVLYHRAGLIEKIDATHIYEVNERSWRLCLDEASDVANAILKKGAKTTIGGYLHVSLCDLLSLMLELVESDTFIGFSDFNRLNEYLSQRKEFLKENKSREILYRWGFGQDRVRALSSHEKELIEHIVSLFKNDSKPWNRFYDLAVPEDNQKEVKDALSDLFPFGLEGDDSLRCAYTSGYFPSWLYLNRRLCEEYHVRPERVDSALGDYCPMLAGMTIEQRKGYELIDLKIEKANGIIALMPNIKQVEDLLLSESFIPQLIECCRAIANQAKSYDESEIAPELTRIEPKLQEAKKQLEKTTAELKEFDAKLVGGLFVSEEDKARKEKLEGVCREWRGTVTDLEDEKRGLIDQQNTIHAFTDRVRKLA